MSKLINNLIKELIHKIINHIKRENINSILVRGASQSFILQIAGTFIMLSSHLLLTRLMGAANYGIYTYVLSWLNILLLLSLMGSTSLLVKYIPIYQSQAQWGALRGLLKDSYFFVLIASFIVSIFTAIVIWQLQNQLNQNLVHTFWIGCLQLPILTLITLHQSALRGFKIIVFAQLPTLILRPIILTFLVVILSFQISQPVNSLITIIFNLLANIISLIFISYIYQKRLPPSIKFSAIEYHHREWLSVALPLFLIAGMQITLNKTDILMIGGILDATQVGIYAVAGKIATLITFSLSAVNAIAAPMISELYAAKKYLELQRMVTIAARGISLYSIPVTLLILFFGNQILSLFGVEFVQGYSSLIILTAGQLVNALAGSVGFLMIMTGNHKKALFVTVCSLGLNFLLNINLIPILGINGAALATSITMIIRNLFLVYYVWKKLGIWSMLI